MFNFTNCVIDWLTFLENFLLRTLITYSCYSFNFFLASSTHSSKEASKMAKPSEKDGNLD